MAWVCFGENVNYSSALGRCSDPRYPTFRAPGSAWGVKNPVPSHWRARERCGILRKCARPNIAAFRNFLRILRNSAEFCGIRRALRTFIRVVQLQVAL